MKLFYHSQNQGARMRPTERRKVNGYFVMRAKDGWEVANSDIRLSGPFVTEQEAIDAAKALPSKG